MGSVYSTQLIDIYIIIGICLENIASVSLECPGRYCLLFVSGRSTGNNSQVIVPTNVLGIHAKQNRHLILDLVSLII